MHVIGLIGRAIDIAESYPIPAGAGPDFQTICRAVIRQADLVGKTFIPCDIRHPLEELGHPILQHSLIRVVYVHIGIPVDIRIIRRKLHRVPVAKLLLPMAVRQVGKSIAGPWKDIRHRPGIVIV